MSDKLGFLEESGYVTDGNVIRHGDTLHDIQVDLSPEIRVLGMIGVNHVNEAQSAIIAGTRPLAYMIIAQGNNIMSSKVRYTDPMVHLYGFDPELVHVKQAIKVEMLGYTALSVITLTEG